MNGGSGLSNTTSVRNRHARRRAFAAHATLLGVLGALGGLAACGAGSDPRGSNDPVEISTAGSPATGPAADAGPADAPPTQSVRGVPVPVLPWDGHTAWDTAFSPDSQSLAVLADRLYVIDLATMRTRAALGVNSGREGSVCFSPDGSRLLMTSYGMSLWDARSGQRLAAPADSYGIEQLDWRGSQGRVAVLQRPRVAVYDMNAGTSLWSKNLEAGSGYARAVALSPDGQWVAALTSPDRLCTWRAADGSAELCRAIGGVGPSTTMAFSSDASLVAVAGLTSAAGAGLGFWRTSEGRQPLAAPSGACGGTPQGIAFHPNRKIFAVQCRASIEIRNLQTRKLQRSWPTEPSSSHGYPSRLRYSPDGHKLVYSGPQQLRIYDADQGKELSRAPEPPTVPRYGQGSPAWSTDATFLLDVRTRHLWITNTGRALPIGMARRQLRHAAFRPNSPVVALAWADGRQELFDATNGTQLWIGPPASHPDGADLVGSLAFDPTGRLLVSSEMTRHSGWQLRLRDGSSGQLLGSYPASGSFEAASFTADGKRVAIRPDALQSQKIRIFDLSRRRIVREGQVAGDSAAFRPDGQAIALGQTLGVLVVDAKTLARQAWLPRTTAALKEHPRATPFVVGWSPDGKQLVVHGPAELTIWDVDAKRVLRTVPLPDSFRSPAEGTASLSHDYRFAAVPVARGIRLVRLADGRSVVMGLLAIEGANVDLITSDLGLIDGDKRAMRELHVRIGPDLSSAHVATLDDLPASLRHAGLLRDFVASKALVPAAEVELTRDGTARP